MGTRLTKLGTFFNIQTRIGIQFLTPYDLIRHKPVYDPHEDNEDDYYDDDEDEYDDEDDEY